MVKKVFGRLHRLPVILPAVSKSPSQALKSVISRDDLGVYASSDTLFRGAVFGRDSLEVAEDLMTIKPKLVAKILLALASLQGEVTNPANEEEPGKIVHEYRRRIVDGQPLDKDSQHIFDQLSAKWGGDQNELVYFGSIDSTPLFIRVLGQYCQRYGLGFLNKELSLRSGRKKNMVQVLKDSVDWLVEQINSSSSGLIEYRRQNPRGILNQVWKDSNEFYVHQNGQLVNHSQPIASIEVQALAYDALAGAAAMLPAGQAELKKRAGDLRQKMLQKLWLAKRSYFGLGLDYDQHGTERLIRTMTANPAELLDSTIFDDLAAQEKEAYIGGLAREIMGLDFLTDAGIRSRALSESKLINFWDYHGSFTSWPKETYDIAKGLRRQGLAQLAAELENRLLNVIRAIRAYPEFLYIDARGRVLGMAAAAHTHGEFMMVDSTTKPEKIQAWTVSAIMAISAQRALHRRFRPARSHRQLPWQINLERQILQHIPHVPYLKSRKELVSRYPTYPYELKKHLS